MATDLASLQIEVVTDTGGSEEKLAAVGAAADAASGQLAGVEAAAKSAGAGFGGINTSSATAAAAFGSLGTATGVAEAALASIDTSAATTAVSLDDMAAAMGVAAGGAGVLGGAMASMAVAIGLASTAATTFAGTTDLGAQAMAALAVSATPLAPAMTEVASATAAVSRESIVLPLHLAHLGETAASGTVSMRTLGSVARGFADQISAVAGALGIGVTALVGITIAQAVFDIAIIKSIKNAQDLDHEISGMAKGVAAGTGLTTEAFNKEIEAAVKMGGVTKASAEEVAKAYVQTGNVVPEQLHGLINATVEFAKETGTTVPQAMATFTSALVSPTAGIAKINDQIKFLTLDQRLEIEALEAEGNATGAAAKTAELLAQKFGQQAASAHGISGILTGLVRTYEDVTAGIGRYIVSVLNQDSALIKWTGSTKAATTIASAWSSVMSGVEKVIAPISGFFDRISISEEAYSKALASGATLAQARAAAENAVARSLDKSTKAEDEAATAAENDAKATKDDTSFLENFVKANDAAGQALATTKAAMDNWNAAQDAGLVKTGAQIAAMQAATVAYRAAQAAIMGTNKALADMTATQDAETKAADDANAALRKEADAAKQAAEALGTGGASDDSSLTAATAATTKSVDDLTTSANNASTALNDVAASATSAASSGGPSADSGTQSFTTQIVSQDTPGLENQYKALAQQIAAAIAAQNTPTQAPTAPAPPAASAGATVASQPGAFGGDQNASFFYDPSSRQEFMSQFGIQGDAATKAADRQYQQEVAAYNLQLQQYEWDKVAAQQQIALMQQQLAALGKIDVSGGYGTIAKPGGNLSNPFSPWGTSASGASGGSWVVNGMPGQDMNYVGMNLSHGELVSVTPPGQSLPGGSGGAPVTVNLTISTPDVASFKQSRSSVVNHVAAMVAAATNNRSTYAR